MVAYFPLQHNPQLKILKNKALGCMSLWTPPTKELAAYYGEQVLFFVAIVLSNLSQITLYFVFLSTYFKWLLLASVVGVVFTAYQIAIDGFDGPGEIFRRVTLTIW